MSRWLRNLIVLQEKRQFHGETAVLFAVFVGAMRFMAEFLLVGLDAPSYPVALIVYITWYWMVFFGFGLAVRLFVPPPWESRINVMLVGLFLGFIPPVIDTLVFGWGGATLGQAGFGYAYVTNFPEGWPWLMVDMNRRMPPGEGLILWAAIGFSIAYVKIRTGQWGRALAAGAVAYGVALSFGSLMPTALRWFTTITLGAGWGAVPFYDWIVYAQLLIGSLLYTVVYRPTLLRRLAYRFVHVAPLIGVALVGFAWIQPLNALALGAVAVMTVAGCLTVVQNEYWDHLEETPEDEPVVTRYDMVMVTFVFWSLTAMLLARDSILGVVLTIYGVASYLYNAPLYRGKRYFPANLKLEGLWGGCAFMIGMLIPAVREMGEFRGLYPAYFDTSVRVAPFAIVHGVDTAIAAVLAAGGWSVVAALKDHKDVQEDAALGTHTLFTLGQRRGHEPDAVLAKLRLITLACMLIGVIGPFAMGRLGPIFAVAMASLAIFMWKQPVQPALQVFRRALLCLTAYLVLLAVGLSLA